MTSGPASASAATERTLKIKANQASNRKSVRLSYQAVMHVMSLVPTHQLGFCHFLYRDETVLLLYVVCWKAEIISLQAFKLQG